MSGPATEPADVVGVFGVSGVGKSTLIARFARSRPEYFHVEASGLIKSRLGDRRVSSEALRTSAPDRIVANQRLLADAFEVARLEHPGQVALLDAHSVIEGDGGLVHLPTAAIAGLGLGRILVVIALPAEILRRRRLDASRPRPVRSVQEIDLAQEESTRQCRRYSAELDVPLGLVDALDEEAFARAVTAR